MENNKSTIWTKTFICIFLANLAMVMSQFLVNPLITTYASWLGAGTTLVGMLSGLYFAVAFLMRPVAGPVITISNHRVLLIITYALGVVVNLLYALSPTIGMFIAVRILHGVQFSVLGALLTTMTSECLPAEKLGAGLGMFSLGTAVGTAIGPSVGMALQTLGVKVFRGEGGGYRMAFLGACFLMLVALIPCFMCSPDAQKLEKNNGKWYDNIIATGAIVPATIQALTMMANNLYTAYLVPYAAEKGFGGISLFFTFYAVAMLIARPFVNRMMEKHGARAVIIPGLIIYALSFITVSLADSIVTVYIAAILAAIGYSTAFPAEQALCIQAAPAEKRAAASNTSYFGNDLGLFAGPAVGGFILSSFETTGRAYAILYRFAIAPLVLGIAICLIYIMYKRKSNKKNV